MFAAVLANVVVAGLGAPPAAQPTLIRLELAAESAVTNVSSAWLWNSHGHAVLMNEGDAHSRGVEGRVLFGRSPVYVGLELGISQITSAPALHDGHGPLHQNTLPRTTTPPTGMSGVSTGTSVTMAAPIGVQSRLGPVLVGVEGLIGWRRMSLESYEGGPTVDGFVPLVETRVRAGVWITPTVSIALVAGKGVVVNDSASLCLSLSLSKLPFDGER
jgi:hypothetical protein